jgi:hypothetical protein
MGRLAEEMGFELLVPGSHRVDAVVALGLATSTPASIQLARELSEILVGPRQLVAERAIGIDPARHHVLREHIRFGSSVKVASALWSRAR